MRTIFYTLGFILLGIVNAAAAPFDMVYTHNTQSSEPEPSYQLAATWWLPDWQGDTRDFSKRTENSSGGGDVKGECGKYGMIASCAAPKEPSGAAKPRPDLACFKQCTCPSSYDKTDANCGTGYKAGTATCDGLANSCVALPCSAGGYYDATQTGNTCSAVTYGGRTCYSCVADPCYNLDDKSPCTHGCQTPFAACTSKCQTCNENPCTKRTDNKTNYGCDKYWADCPSKCEIGKTCGPVDCSAYPMTSIPSNAKFSYCFRGCGDNIKRYKIDSCNANYVLQGGSCVSACNSGFSKISSCSNWYDNFVADSKPGCGKCCPDAASLAEDGYGSFITNTACSHVSPCGAYEPMTNCSPKQCTAGYTKQKWSFACPAGQKVVTQPGLMSCKKCEVAQSCIDTVKAKYPGYSFVSDVEDLDIANSGNIVLLDKIVADATYLYNNDHFGEPIYLYGIEYFGCATESGNTASLEVQYLGLNDYGGGFYGYAPIKATRFVIESGGENINFYNNVEIENMTANAMIYASSNSNSAIFRVNNIDFSGHYSTSSDQSIYVENMSDVYIGQIKFKGGKANDLEQGSLKIENCGYVDVGEVGNSNKYLNLDLKFINSNYLFSGRFHPSVFSITPVSGRVDIFASANTDLSIRKNNIDKGYRVSLAWASTVTIDGKCIENPSENLGEQTYDMYFNQTCTFECNQPCSQMCYSNLRQCR